VTTQRASRLTATAFVRHHTEDEKDSSEPRFVAHVASPAPQRRTDGPRPKQPRSFVSSPKGQRGLVKNPAHPSRLVDDRGFELREEIAPGLYGQRPTSNDVRTGGGGSGSSRYEVDIVKDRLPLFRRPITVFARGGKRPPKTAAEVWANTKLGRAAATRRGKSFSYHRRPHETVWRAQRKPGLTEPERQSRRLDLDRASWSSVVRRRSRGDLPRSTLAAITGGTMFLK
jgi:hypothetical protein